MALFEDLEPPQPSEDEKIKKIKNIFRKSKNYLNIYIQKTNNTFLILLNKLRFVVNFRQKSSLFNGLKLYSPHFALIVVAVVVLLSNFSVHFAKADIILDTTEPNLKIAFAKEADKYTPLINTDGQAVESSYYASGDFTTLGTSVATNITQREEPLPDNSVSTINYAIKGGDNLTTLSWKFDVKLTTIKYVNNITDEDMIKPGQSLKIPPRGYEVSPDLIAKREKDKEKARLAAASRSTVYRESTSRTTKSTLTAVNHPAGNRNNGYAYGFCTWYVATKRAIPSGWGNANRWLSSARNSGYSTGSTPVPGAVGVTSESWWGHVTYVESISGDQVTISEMNYKGWGVVNRRTVSASYFRGFIY